MDVTTWEILKMIVIPPAILFIGWFAKTKNAEVEELRREVQTSKTDIAIIKSQLQYANKNLDELKSMVNKLLARRS